MIIKSVKFAVAGYSNFFLFRYIQYPVTGNEVPIRAAIKVTIFENLQVMMGYAYLDAKYENR